jgi:hypothetical protein
MRLRLHTVRRLWITTAIVAVIVLAVGISVGLSFSWDLTITRYGIPVAELLLSLLFAPILPLMVWVLVRVVRDRHPEAGHCSECGYNHTGNVTGRCPECGTVFSLRVRCEECGRGSWFFVRLKGTMQACPYCGRRNNVPDSPDGSR